MCTRVDFQDAVILVQKDTHIHCKRKQKSGREVFIPWFHILQWNLVISFAKLYSKLGGTILFTKYREIFMLKIAIC